VSTAPDFGFECSLDTQGHRAMRSAVEEKVVTSSYAEGTKQAARLRRPTCSLEWRLNPGCPYCTHLALKTEGIDSARRRAGMNLPHPPAGRVARFWLHPPSWQTNPATFSPDATDPRSPQQTEAVAVAAEASCRLAIAKRSSTMTGFHAARTASDACRLPACRRKRGRPADQLGRLDP
jgi:hypothetical protein